NLTPPGGPASVSKAAQVSMGEFMEAVLNGEPRDGRVAYLSGHQTIAEVSAHFSARETADGTGVQPGRFLQSTGRLTDVDVEVLRAKRFVESGAGVAAVPAVKTFRDYLLPFVEACTQILGVGLLLVVIFLVLQ